MGLTKQRRLLGTLMLVTICLVAPATFFILLGTRPPDTIGEARLHLYYKSPTKALLPLPNDWRARYGIERHEKCAILIDGALVPRLTACTFDSGYENGAYSGDAVSAQARATMAAERRRNPDERVSSDVRQTGLGPIYHVVRTYPTSATHHVVTSGQVVEHEFFRPIGNRLVHLRTYQDAEQRSSLDSIAWELAQGLVLVAEP
jgi:hypothetical protein